MKRLARAVLPLVLAALSCAPVAAAATPSLTGASVAPRHGDRVDSGFGEVLCRKQGRYGRPARPKRLIGRGWPELGAAS